MYTAGTEILDCPKFHHPFNLKLHKRMVSLTDENKIVTRHWLLHFSCYMSFKQAYTNHSFQPNSRDELAERNIRFIYQ